MKLLLRSHALVLMTRACIEHPPLLHVVCAAGATLFYHDLSTLNRVFAAGFSSRFASILLRSGAIPVLSSILSPALSGKRSDVVHLACKCLLRLASARLPDKCAAAAAAAVLKCSLLSALAVHMTPQPPPSETLKISKSKSSRLVNVRAVHSPASVTSAVADAAPVKFPPASLQKECAAATATAAACAVVRSWFIWYTLSLQPLQTHRCGTHSVSGSLSRSMLLLFKQAWSSRCAVPLSEQCPHASLSCTAQALKRPRKQIRTAELQTCCCCASLWPWLVWPTKIAPLQLSSLQNHFQNSPR
jgi:hypothetical protein